MLASAADVLPVGIEWSYEVKWDGYRALVVKDGAAVRLISRNQKDLTRDYPTVVAAVRTVRTSALVLDGEIVALDADGRPSFQALQHRSTSGLAVVFYAFDVLTVGRESLRQQSLDARRRRLKQLILGSHVMLSEPLPGSPERIEREVRRLGLEGVIAKRRDSRYEPGQRSDAWVKVKFSPQQEFVIGGYKPEGSGLESVLVGYYDNERRFYYAAKLRAGLTPHLRADLLRLLAPTSITRCPFVNLPNSSGRSHWGEGISAEDMRTLRWVNRTLVVQVAFVEWTREGLLRHPRFVGVRSDEAPGDVRREQR
jgi:bifunctional non-homologous end joining protein LigD